MNRQADRQTDGWTEEAAPKVEFSKAIFHKAMVIMPVRVGFHPQGTLSGVSKWPDMVNNGGKKLGDHPSDGGSN